MNETDLAYAAGIIDGEGTILITHHKALPGRCQEGYRVVVEFGMCDATAPMWFLVTFGGRCKGYDRILHRHCRMVYRWNQTDSKAAEFLRLILPYLKTKKAQAEIALEYQDLKRSNRLKYPIPSRKPLAFLQAEAILSAKVKALNNPVLTGADDAV
jgi:hypothetical protein